MDVVLVGVFVMGVPPLLVTVVVDVVGVTMVVVVVVGKVLVDTVVSSQRWQHRSWYWSDESPSPTASGSNCGPATEPRRKQLTLRGDDGTELWSETTTATESLDTDEVADVAEAMNRILAKALENLVPGLRGALDGLEARDGAGS